MEQLKFALFERALIQPLAGELTAVEQHIAALLLNATQQQPLKLSEIRAEVERGLGMTLSEREGKRVIRSLRRIHALPILASRKPPQGYWWCSNVAEMDAFIKYFRGVALDELATLAKIVRSNYPALAGQLHLEMLEEEE